MQLRFFCLPAFILIMAVMATSAKAQLPKQIPARRATTVIKIDGKLDDIAWKDAPIATNFVELRPVAFRKEEQSNRTEVYFLYDDQVIYIGGYCHEKTKDSIQTELIV